MIKATGSAAGRQKRKQQREQAQEQPEMLRETTVPGGRAGSLRPQPPRQAFCPDSESICNHPQGTGWGREGDMT